MSTRFVKKQLSNLAAETSQLAPVQNKPSKKALKRKQKSKAKAVKAAAASDPKQVFQKNLAYFKSTKGAQEETATLMSKVCVAKQLSTAGATLVMNISMLTHILHTALGQGNNEGRRFRRFRLLTWDPFSAQQNYATASCCRRIYSSVHAALWDAHSADGLPRQAGPH